MKKYIHIANKIYNSAWMIKPEMLDSIAKQFINHLKGEMPMVPECEPEDDMKSEIDAEEVKTGPTVAVLSIDGIIGKRLSELETMCGGVDLNAVRDELNELANDEAITAIVLDMNSPGGTVQGVPEMFQLIKEINAKKRCYAFVDVLAASAGYYIASACEAIYCTPSAELGSVGVYMLAVDESRKLEMEGVKVNAITNAEATLKLAGASFKPMTEQERAHFQNGVQKTYDMFKADVLSTRTIDAQYLDGRCVDGEEAVNLGFADGIVNSINDVISIAVSNP